MFCSIDDKTTQSMPKRLLPDWMNSSPAPKRLKPNPSKDIVREIPDDMDAEFREESGRNNVELSAYAGGIDGIHIYEGPPTPPNDEEWWWPHCK